jgi:nucleotide-binding universal stress UspA family protein
VPATSAARAGPTSRPDDPPSTPVVRRVVVGYDGSGPAGRAVDLALDSTRPSGAEVWVVHALDPPHLVAEPRTPEELQSESVAVSEVLLDLQEQAAGEGFRLIGWSREGPAAEVLHSAIREVHANLVIVGTRGLRAPVRALLGPVSSRILARAGRLVAVVP